MPRHLLSRMRQMHQGARADGCLQPYSRPGHIPTPLLPPSQLARRVGRILALNCRETEALNTGPAKSQVDGQQFGAQGWALLSWLWPSAFRASVFPLLKRGRHHCCMFTSARASMQTGLGRRTTWGRGLASPGEQSILIWAPQRQQRKTVCGLLIQKAQERPEQTGQSQGRGDVDSWGPPHQRATCSSAPGRNFYRTVQISNKNRN